MSRSAAQAIRQPRDRLKGHPQERQHSALSLVSESTGDAGPSAPGRGDQYPLARGDGRPEGPRPGIPVRDARGSACDSPVRRSRTRCQPQQATFSAGLSRNLNYPTLLSCVAARIPARRTIGSDWPDVSRVNFSHRGIRCLDTDRAARPARRHRRACLYGGRPRVHRERRSINLLHQTIRTLRITVSATPMLVSRRKLLCGLLHPTSRRLRGKRRYSGGLGRSRHSPLSSTRARLAPIPSARKCIFDLEIGSAQPKIIPKRLSWTLKTLQLLKD